MDFLVAIAGLLGILFLYNLIYTRTNQRSKNRAPKLPGAWPIIGHLHLFEYDNPPLCKKLGAMADKHGPVFTVQLGMKSMLVVNNVEAAKECYTTNDVVLSSRPAGASGKYMGYNYTMVALSPYGPHFIQIKKLAKSEIFSARRLEMVKHHRVSEIEAFVKELHRLCNCNDIDDQAGGSSTTTATTKVVMSDIFSRLVFNLLCRMISGTGVFRSVTVDDEKGLCVKRLLEEYNEGLEFAVLSDVFPIPLLEWLDLQGHIKIMKHRAAEFDSFLQGWIDQHRRRRSVDGPARSDEDFTDFLLSAMENGAVPSEYVNDTNVKAILGIIFLGGNSTIPVCLTWTLSLLLNNEHALKRVQEELDQKIGRDRWAEEYDIKSLFYLQAIVHESLRLYPPAPLGVPHEATEDCYVYGYHISKGTQILFNIWKIHRDPRIWIEPHKFLPERWLTSQEIFDASRYHYEFIAFSLGRRSCPGMPLALPTVHLIMARLIQGFNFSRPTDMSIDMSEHHTLIQQKALPLEVAITPRLHPKLYLEI